jgi:hypothetical protein
MLTTVEQEGTAKTAAFTALRKRGSIAAFHVRCSGIPFAMKF